MSYSALLLPNGKQRFVDNNGGALVGGKVYFYAAGGGSTPKDTWSTPGMTVLNENPLTLDARGEAIIYGVGDYRQVVNDALGNLIWDQPTQGYQTPSLTVGTVNLNLTIDGGGSTPSTGVCGDDYCPFECVITLNTIQAIGSGSLVLDVWVAPFVAGSPPTVANSIVASAPPTLTAAQSVQDSVLTGWSKTIPAGSAIRYNLVSISGITHFTNNMTANVSA